LTTDLTVLLAVLAFALLTMPVYALRGSVGREDRLASDAHGDFVLGSFLVGWLYWFIHPVIRLALAFRLGPTAFNFLGVAFGILAGVFFATGELAAGGWCVLLGGVADILDGRIARAMGVADARGAFLDSTLDRFAEVGAFVGLAVYFRDSVTGTLLVAGALGGSLLVSYARARGESQGVLCNRGIMQRAERLLLLGFGGLFVPAPALMRSPGAGSLLLVVVGIIAMGTVVTAVYRTFWIAGKLSEETG